MNEIVKISSPAGLVHLRPERDEDRDFRYRLFCDSRQPEFALLLPPPVYQQLMAHQFHAQTVSYRNDFPRARFDIIELGGEPIGRIVVDRPGTMVYIVDQAVTPALRGRGIGTAMMRALMVEAQAAGLPLRLKVAQGEEAALRLYLRLGFVPIEQAPLEQVPLYMELEWRGPRDPAPG